MTEFSPKEEDRKYGHIIIDFIEKDSSLSIGLLAKEIAFNNKNYYTDKDIVDEVRDIALKNKAK